MLAPQRTNSICSLPQNPPPLLSLDHSAVDGVVIIPHQGPWQLFRLLIYGGRNRNWATCKETSCEFHTSRCEVTLATLWAAANEPTSETPHDCESSLQFIELANLSYPYLYGVFDPWTRFSWDFPDILAREFTCEASYEIHFVSRKNSFKLVYDDGTFLGRFHARLHDRWHACFCGRFIQPPAVFVDVLVSVEQRRNAWAGRNWRSPRKTPPTTGIVRHDFHMRKSESDRFAQDGRRIHVLTRAFMLQFMHMGNVADVVLCWQGFVGLHPSLPALLFRGCSIPTYLTHADDQSLFVKHIGALPEFCKRKSCRMIPLVGGFSLGFPVSRAFTFRWPLQGLPSSEPMRGAERPRPAKPLFVENKFRGIDREVGK
ncbi:hypothetical protein PR048_017846 [Dryococelus australis]|uniref:Uncharacterized protein n=1 Tax=Dryococelus australis TaxID=614101 RepID=A0ABQ9HAT7_9NEOP|nr:hypothetical protein PR048_017846 [Dryococelus australis]